uniref:Uncharacterized protein n=1 Tax=Sphaerodactylus townsendi TaxID=933632 RepID=A0ACB8F9T5_9SAUR
MLISTFTKGKKIINRESRKKKMFTKPDQLASISQHLKLKKNPFSEIKRHLMVFRKLTPHTVIDNDVILLSEISDFSRDSSSREVEKVFSKHLSNLIISQLAENRKDAPL